MLGVLRRLARYAHDDDASHSFFTSSSASCTVATSTIRNSEPFTPLALPVELKVTHAVRNFGMARAFELEVTRAVSNFGMALSVEVEGWCF